MLSAEVGRGHALGIEAGAIFAGPGASALARVGVIDVGSNSVRLVVFDGAARSPAYFYNEKLMCGLGAGMGETGRLSQKGRERALAALTRFAALLRAMEARPVIAVATAAVREAADGPAFVAEVRARTGLELTVLDGAEEARLAAQGVLLGWPGAEGVVSDIGGASMELAAVGAGEVGARRSLPLGPLRLEGLGGRKARARYIAGALEQAGTALAAPTRRLYLVGGAWRALARLDMARRGYPMPVLHEYRLTRRQVLATLDWLAATPTETLRAASGVSAERLRLAPLAGEVLRALLAASRPGEIAVSGYGIREGVLFEQMPDELRARDPLLEACRHAEAGAARMPGVGERLFNFVLPLFRTAAPGRLRLAHAACLLHDTSWRAHPDYRHEICFDNATRANLGGLDHEGRVFLGLALLHRYKNSRSGSRIEALLGLLSDEQITAAEALGKAMRFGAMFAPHALDRLAALHFQPRRKRLELRLDAAAEPLYGEVAAARFAALGKALGAETAVRVRGP